MSGWKNRMQDAMKEYSEGKQSEAIAHMEYIIDGLCHKAEERGKALKAQEIKTALGI